VIARRIDVQLEFDGMDLRAFLVGSEDAGLCAGNGDGAGEVGIVRVQDVVIRPSLLVAAGPVTHSALGNAFIALRPHPAQFGGETEGEVGGVQAIEFEQHDGAGLPPVPAGFVGENMICRTVKATCE
jgi:hypothetical protein